MKTQLFFIILIFKIYICQVIKRGSVFKCHDNAYRDEQCLTHEKLGDVDFYWVRKCKGAKVCAKLPYYGNMTGVCSIKVRPHYDGESCQKNNKCTSGICANNKCKGFIDGHSCQPGLGQCKKGKVCRKTSADSIYICTDPISEGKSCNNLITEISENDDYFENDSKKYYLPENNICELGCVCSNTNCTPIHSIDDGNNSTNPLACKSGAIYNNKCFTYPSNNITCNANNTCQITTAINIPCLKTSKGAYWCPNSAINQAFTEWYNEWYSNYKSNNDINLEAYRYTANKKSVNELFFRYKYFGLITDADECAYDYFWKNNSSTKLRFPIIIIIISLVFLF